MNPWVDFSTLFVPKFVPFATKYRPLDRFFYGYKWLKPKIRYCWLRKACFLDCAWGGKSGKCFLAIHSKCIALYSIQYTVNRCVQDKKQNEDERKYYCTSKPCKNHRLVSGSRYIKLKNNKLNIHQISKKLCFDEKTWHLKLKKCNDHILYFFLFTFIIYCNNCEGILFVNARIRPHWDMYIVKLDPDPHQDIL